MSSPVSLFGAGNQSTRASSRTSPVPGCLIFRNAAKRGLGGGAAIRSIASPAAGPEMRMTATPARPCPLERAKMVSVTVLKALRDSRVAASGLDQTRNAKWDWDLPINACSVIVFQQAC